MYSFKSNGTLLLSKRYSFKTISFGWEGRLVWYVIMSVIRSIYYAYVHTIVFLLHISLEGI